MSKFFKRHIYGDKKEDFSSQSLPSNRKALFSYLIKTRLLRLVYINLLSFVFFIPLIAWLIVSGTYEQSFGDVYSEQVFQTYLYFILYTKAPLMIISYLIAFLGLSGTFYVVRLTCWNVPIKIGKGFLKGMKQSWMPFIVYGLFIGVYLSVFEVAYLLIFIGQYEIYLTIFLLSSLIISMVLILSIIIFSMTLSATYNIKLISALKSGFKLTIRYFIKNIAIFLIAFTPSIIWFLLGNIWFLLIGTIIAMIFGVIYPVLIIHLYTNSLFDYYINKDQYQDYFRKGLAPINGVEK